MKKLVSIIIILAFVLAPNAFAQNAATKLGRGVADIVESPIELVNGITQYSQHNPITGIAAGTLMGTVGMMTRILAGVYELVTFPVPIPAGYMPVMEPEYPTFEH